MHTYGDFTIDVVLWGGGRALVFKNDVCNNKSDHNNGFGGIKTRILSPPASS